VAAAAQQPARRELLRTPEGVVLDFHPDGVWRVKARRVAEQRRRLLSARDYPALNAPAILGAAAAPVQGAQAAVTGTLRVPTILFRFQDVGTGAAYDSSEYRSVLYGTPPAAGRPYSIATFYRELSNGLFELDGRILGWVALDSVEETYTGQAGTCESNPHGTNNCNGLFGTGFSRLQIGLREAISKLDSLVDFGTFDSDGPDGVPNSGDDDGIVDLVLFVHSEEDGACVSSSNNHIWAHRSSALSGFPSDDPAAGGGVIRFRDYTIQSGVGGSGGCTESQIMAIGTTAHETGHGLGLPDLYDTSQETEGVGEWDLMGSGNWSVQSSPSRMGAWSLDRLGWVAIQEISIGGTYSLSPATNDTAFLIRPTGANSRGEYLLLENRQPLESDSAMTRVHCGRSGLTFPTNCGGGLAVWHIDSLRLASGGGVNRGLIHGVAVVQADGLNNLRQEPYNRGDAGDLWPGATGRTRFARNGMPPARLNTGEYMGFELDSISEAGEHISFQLRLGGVTVVRASNPAVPVRVDGITHTVFDEVLEAGTVHTVDVDSLTVSSDERTAYRFLSWSDGGARTHDFTATVTGDSLVATVLPTYRVRVATAGSGSVVALDGSDVGAGVYFDAGTDLTLVAVPAPNSVFDRWQGDLTALSDTLQLDNLARSFELEARFLGPPAVALDGMVDQLLGVANVLSADDKRFLDLSGNRNNRFDVGDFLAWLEASGQVTSAVARGALRDAIGAAPNSTDTSTHRRDRR
jgi:immune inhibitor A